MAADFKVFAAGLFHSAAKISYYHAGAWQEVQRIRRWTRVGSTFSWKDVYVKSGTTPTPSPSPTPAPTPTPPVTLSLTATPTSVSGSRVGTGTVFTNTVTITVGNGTAPYTYNFSRVSYSGSQIPAIVDVAGNPNKKQFSRVMNGTVPETQTARFKCIVVDANGNTGTIYIDATFRTIILSGTGGSGTINTGKPGDGGDIP